MNIKKQNKITVSIVLFSIVLEIFVFLFELTKIPEVSTSSFFYSRVYLYLVVSVVLVILLVAYTLFTRNIKLSKIFTRYNFMVLSMTILVIMMILAILYYEMSLLFLVLLGFFEYLKIDYLFSYFSKNKKLDEYESHMAYYQQESWLAKSKILKTMEIFQVVAILVLVASFFNGSLNIEPVLRRQDPNEYYIPTALPILFLSFVVLGLLIYDFICIKKNYFIYLFIVLVSSIAFMIYTSGSFIPHINNQYISFGTELNFVNYQYLTTTLIASSVMLFILLIGFFLSKHSFKKTIEYILVASFAIVTALTPQDQSNIIGKGLASSAWAYVFFILLILFCLISIWKNKKEVANIEHYNNLNEASLFKISKK